MGFVSVLSFAHELARQRVRPGETAIDATAGNGNDTLLLAQLVGRGGRVLAFDIQEAALEHTGRRLTQAGIEWVTMDRAPALSRDTAVRLTRRCDARCFLVQSSHAEMERWIDSADERPIAAVMFNLGYLPGLGVDQSVITRADSTLPAMAAALRLLRPGGVLTAVLYPGHPGGAEEASAVEQWAAGLIQAEAQVLLYRFGNALAAAPYLLAVEKKSAPAYNQGKVAYEIEESGELMTVNPYPLQFQPEMKERVWGGRALEQFGLALPPGRIGEGWMIGDHPNGTTKVVNGEFAGRGLDDIRRQYGRDWFGAKGFSEKNGRFPLLIKLLDCEDDLSVQVHPSDSYERLPSGELGKTEMWYILSARPGAKIIYGLEPGVTRQTLAEAVADGRIMDCLHEVSVEAGDSFYIPAGTVHALCSGVLVAEIQQNSDTTYRLYDYNRAGLDGKPRELHIEDSLNVIAYEGAGATRMKTELSGPHEWLTLAESPYFVTQKGRVEGEWPLSTAADSFTILIVCEGSGALSWDGGRLETKAGQCLLLPATLGGYRLEGGMTVLRSYAA